jgi:hypothetical protein
MPAPELVVDYAQRPQFIPFHRRCQRFACIVTHRRAGKTVACIHDLQLGATQSNKIRPRFAYLSPFLKQSKAVAWDYLFQILRRYRRSLLLRLEHAHRSVRPDLVYPNLTSNLFASSCDNQHAFLVTSDHNNKNQYNNCSGDKQSSSQKLIPLTAIPHKEACHQ